MNSSLIIVSALLYIGLLFCIAAFADHRRRRGHSLIKHPWFYSLSLAIYCTAWTYYGSVGRAATTGAGFLPIYLGPTLAAMLWWFVLRKMVRIAKRQRITSIADFIGSRYGKSSRLASLVAIISLLGLLPYVSLQLKALAISFGVLSHYPAIDSGITGYHLPVWQDSTFYIALLMALFAVLFGTRHLDATEQHEGVIAAIAFESVFKLTAFLAVGIFTTFFVFNGPGDIFSRALADPATAELLQTTSLAGGHLNWFFLILISALAVFLLPRQFQVTVVEIADEKHVDTASWLFPLYLLLINLFVLPLALGGLLMFPDGSVDPDTFVLTIPMAAQQPWLALLVFLGGLSAATSMLIVASVAMATMLSNELIMPLLLRRRIERGEVTPALVLRIRRVAIVGILLFGYGYFRLFGESYALVTIGLMSFVAVAQFAPAVFLGMYWRDVNRFGATAGLLAGFVIWAYTLFFPALARSGWLPMDFVEHGLFGLEALHPYALFGLEGLDPVGHATLWSLSVNLTLTVILSVFSRQGPVERLQANAFVNPSANMPPIWQGDVSREALEQLVGRFLGKENARVAFDQFLQTRQLRDGDTSNANLYLAGHAETLLSGVIGASNARSMVSELYQGRTLSVEQMIEVLSESSQILLYSQRLQEKTRELEQTASELQTANDQLRELDHLKDEFVSTVSHELRTPLTSIRSFSEILRDTPDLPEEQQREFLGIIVTESERLTRLINDVLDVAKLESGTLELDKSALDIAELAQQAANAVAGFYADRQVSLETRLPAEPLFCEADADRLQQVIINLLSNSAKFCEAKTGQVVLSVARRGADIEVSVSDNGPGIDPAKQPVVFDRFLQISNREKGKPVGTGLGLTISKLIVEQHGGQIAVESDGHSGSRFYFTIPASTSPDQKGA
ncbi:sensor histidine kinase [Granulosicoccaceae sp. 1_MG-2023]|nr:sensor histidine kinase [Granulosicoccaceae sp. 1_MG-2023]